MPRAIHFELFADDPERAAQFYADLFGWRADPWQGETGPIYWLLTTGDESDPGINGDLQQRTHPSDTAAIIIPVSSIDQYAAQIAAAGGSILTPKFSIPGIGYAAYFHDPEGNRLGLFQSDETAA